MKNKVIFLVCLFSLNVHAVLIPTNNLVPKIGPELQAKLRVLQSIEDNAVKAIALVEAVDPCAQELDLRAIDKLLVFLRALPIQFLILDKLRRVV